MTAKKNLPARMADDLLLKYRAAIDGTKAILIFGSALLNKEAELETDWHKSTALQEWLEANCPDVNYGVAKRLYQRAEALHKSLGLTPDAKLGGLLEANNRKLTPDERAFRRTIEDMIEGRGTDQMRFEFDFNLKMDAAPNREKTVSGGSRTSAEGRSERANLLSAIDQITRGGKAYPEGSSRFSILACVVMLFAAKMEDKARAMAESGNNPTESETWSALIALLLQNVGRLLPEDARVIRDLLQTAAES